MTQATTSKLSFASDYMQGAHPQILERLCKTNMVPCAGYGADEFSDAAREKIREACKAYEADIFFLAGGTQANTTVLSSLLAPYQGVIAANTGHISTHEAGAIEYGGHKVIELAHTNGKLVPADVGASVASWENDANHEHMVMPGAVYFSQPTEYGTLYTLEELEELSNICHEHGLALYLDGARLAYALAAKQNNVSLADIARLCDVFYIGGTKCGTLIGEAVVFPKHNFIPHFFSMTKQRGALLAKGRVCGVQFDELFTNGLYERIGASAIAFAGRIREALDECGLPQAIESFTNQIFVELTREQVAFLEPRVDMGFWEHTQANTTIMRLATSWATREEDVVALMELLRELSRNS